MAQPKAAGKSKIDALAEQAEKNGYYLVPKEPVKGYVKNGAFNVDVAEGSVAQYIQNALLFHRKPLDLNNFEAVCDRAEQYYIQCAETNVPPTQIGLAQALGVSKNTLIDWKSGARRDSRYKELANQCSEINEKIIVEMALQNKINNIAAIVQLKNHFGYTDEQKVVVEQKESVVDDSLQLADVIAIANEEKPQKASYKPIDKR